jgi:hypothetical protein
MKSSYLILLSILYLNVLANIQVFPLDLSYELKDGGKVIVEFTKSSLTAGWERPIPGANPSKDTKTIDYAKLISLVATRSKDEETITLVFHQSDRNAIFYPELTLYPVFSYTLYGLGILGIEKKDYRIDTTGLNIHHPFDKEGKERLNFFQAHVEYICPGEKTIVEDYDKLAVFQVIVSDVEFISKLAEKPVAEVLKEVTQLARVTEVKLKFSDGFRKDFEGNLNPGLVAYLMMISSKRISATGSGNESAVGLISRIAHSFLPHKISQHEDPSAGTEMLPIKQGDKKRVKYP